MLDYWVRERWLGVMTESFRKSCASGAVGALPELGLRKWLYPAAGCSRARSWTVKRAGTHCTFTCSSESFVKCCRVCANRVDSYRPACIRRAAHSNTPSLNSKPISPALAAATRFPIDLTLQRSAYSYLATTVENRKSGFIGKILDFQGVVRHRNRAQRPSGCL